jgi:hypothetical protein
MMVMTTLAGEPHLPPHGSCRVNHFTLPVPLIACARRVRDLATARAHETLPVGPCVHDPPRVGRYRILYHRKKNASFETKRSACRC